MWTVSRLTRHDVVIRLRAVDAVPNVSDAWGRHAPTPTPDKRPAPRQVQRPRAFNIPVASSSGDVYLADLCPETDPQFPSYINASIPQLAGCVSYGESMTEALTNIRNALDAYLDDCEQDD